MAEEKKTTKTVSKTVSKTADKNTATPKVATPTKAAAKTEPKKTVAKAVTKTASTKTVAKAEPKKAVTKTVEKKVETKKAESVKKVATKVAEPKATSVKKVATQSQSVGTIQKSEKPVKEAKKEVKRTIRVTLVKSYIGYNNKQARIVKALGLNKINSTHDLVDNPCVRGMIFQVKHLIRVEEI